MNSSTLSARPRAEQCEGHQDRGGGEQQGEQQRAQVGVGGGDAEAGHGQAGRAEHHHHEHADAGVGLARLEHHAGEGQSAEDGAGRTRRRDERGGQQRGQPEGDAQRHQHALPGGGAQADVVGVDRHGGSEHLDVALGRDHADAGGAQRKPRQPVGECRDQGDHDRVGRCLSGEEQCGDRGGDAHHETEGDRDEVHLRTVPGEGEGDAAHDHRAETGGGERPAPDRLDRNGEESGDRAEQRGGESERVAGLRLADPGEHGGGRDEQHHSAAGDDGADAEAGPGGDQEHGAEREEAEADGEGGAGAVLRCPLAVLRGRGVDDRLHDVVVDAGLGDQPAAHEGEQFAVVHALAAEAAAHVEHDPLCAVQRVAAVGEGGVEHAEAARESGHQLDQGNLCGHAHIESAALAHDRYTY